LGGSSSGPEAEAQITGAISGTPRRTIEGLKRSWHVIVPDGRHFQAISVVEQGIDHAWLTCDVKRFNLDIEDPTDDGEGKGLLGGDP
jgi:hypothetical protein